MLTRHLSRVYKSKLKIHTDNQKDKFSINSVTQRQNNTIHAQFCLFLLLDVYFKFLFQFFTNYKHMFCEHSQFFWNT